MLKFKENDFDSLDSQGIIKGYASVFGNRDSDGDVIAEGAYTKTLQENGDRIAFLYQHDMSKPIGKKLKLEEDENGLFAEARISDSSLGKDVRTMVMEGILKEFSVGFIPIKEEQVVDVNYIREIKLFEFSLVTLAANPLAQVTEYKSQMEATDSIVDDFDKLAKIVRKMDNPHLLEFEFRKLQSKVSLLLQKSNESSLKKEEVEQRRIVSELDKFIKSIN